MSGIKSRKKGVPKRIYLPLVVANNWTRAFVSVNGIKDNRHEYILKGEERQRTISEILDWLLDGAQYNCTSRHMYIKATDIAKKLNEMKGG
jgi:hypothetical protein